MTDKPWRTDPMYGGMSDESARLSYEAWVRQGRKPLPRHQYHLESDEKIELRKRQIEVQMKELEEAIAAARSWMTGWRAKQRSRGFKFMEEA